MKTLDASIVRARFAGVLDTVRADGQPVVIVRYGRPIAALVPIERLAPRELRALNERPPASSPQPVRGSSRAR